MNKLEYLAFTATMIFAVCWIGTNCLAAASEESEVAVIYLQEDESIEDIPEIIFNEPSELVVSTGDGRTVEIDLSADEETQVFGAKKQPANNLYQEPGTTLIVNDAEEEEEPEEPEPEYTYYASYEITAYIWTGNPCADGVYPSVGYTVASNDPALWHKWIYIEGIGDRYVHDTGGMASNVIDLFVGSHEEAIQFGRQVREIYIYE